MNLRVAFAIFFTSYLASCDAEDQLRGRELDAEPWLSDGFEIDEIPAAHKLGKGYHGDCYEGGASGGAGA